MTMTAENFIRSATEPDKLIDNILVRFTLLAQVAAIPKAGESLQLAARVAEVRAFGLLVLVGRVTLDAAKGLGAS